MTQRIEHGGTVGFSSTLERKTESRPDATGRYPRTWKVWTAKAHEPRTGIFLGWRTLRDGTRDWEEGGPYFEAKGAPLAAALVSYSTTRKPVYVLAEALEAQGESGTASRLMALVEDAFQEGGRALYYHLDGGSYVVDESGLAEDLPKLWKKSKARRHASKVVS
jgi:hypothetical protein